ncbi:MAG: hypothetical protein AAF823_08660 [Planctomycetota bacterium]
MQPAEFTDLLDRASTCAVDFAQGMAIDRLPESLRYRVLLNQSCDDNATDREVVYPDDDDVVLDNLDAEDVVKSLCREGRCPVWINIRVEASAIDYTLLVLDCCGRFTDDASKMYYSHQGTGPFGIKSPVLPVGFKKGERFALRRVNRRGVIAAALRRIGRVKERS